MEKPLIQGIVTSIVELPPVSRGSFVSPRGLLCTSGGQRASPSSTVRTGFDCSRFGRPLGAFLRSLPLSFSRIFDEDLMLCRESLSQIRGWTSEPGSRERPTPPASTRLPHWLQSACEKTSRCVARSSDHGN